MYHAWKQYVLAQYYYVVPEAAIPVDGVDEKLKCISLRWDRHWEADDIRERGKFSALCNLDSVHSPVHIKRYNAPVDLLHDTVPYKIDLRDRLKSPTEW